MNPQKLLIAVVLLAALGGAVWYTMENPPEDENTETSVLSLQEDSVRRLIIDRPGHDRVEVSRDEDGNWVFAGHPFPVDSAAVGLLTTNLTDLNAERLVGDDVTEWTQYGFEAPALTLGIAATEEEEGDREYQLQFGNQAPGGTGRYARLVGDPKLFILYDYIQTSFEKEVFDLREKKLLDVDSDSVTALRVAVGSRETRFAKAGGDWSIAEPITVRADQFSVSDLARSVQNAEMVSVLAEDGAPEEASPGDAFAEAVLVDSAGEHTVSLFKRGEGAYTARSSDRGNAIFEVSSTFAEALDKELESYRDRNVYSFGFQDIKNIEVVRGGETLTIERAEEKWTLTSDGGRELVAENVQGFIDALRGLSADSFPADSLTAWPRHGLEPAEATVSVVTEDGSVAETALFSGWDSTPLYVAREGEPPIYEMETATTETLRQSFEKLTDAPEMPEPAEEDDSPAAGSE